ncbi:MAG: class II glutamine amidotransferase [Lachnospiraceae bacterium]|nr:class II glutamine amidotransferase [Lachnospiraceae bacterium]
MCELFGLSGRGKVNIGQELREFYSHAPENPNGWGIFLHDDNVSFVDKEDKRADRSDYLRSLLSGRVRAKDAIAHIRLATIGYDEISNTHPFRGCDLSAREWILAHNGTIFEGESLNKYVYEQDGETDSERILLYLIDGMNQAIKDKQGALDEDERFEVIQDIVTELSPKNKLNLLIYDGEVLYAHTNYKDSLYERHDDRSIYFSTKPLKVGLWENVPFTRLMSYKDGRELRAGVSHGNEYIPDECSINALYLAYSGL